MKIFFAKNNGIDIKSSLNENEKAELHEGGKNTMTVNEAIAFQNILKNRVSQLSALREKVSTQDRLFFSNQEKVIEPQYDVKKLDEKVTFLQNWQYRIDARIKEVNAKTQVGLDIPEAELLSPIQ